MAIHHSFLNFLCSRKKEAELLREQLHTGLDLLEYVESQMSKVYISA